MKAFTDKLGQFQALIVAILGLLTAVGVDKVGLLAILRNPLDWGIWEPLFLGVMALIVGAAIARQTYTNASRLKDPNALRLDPAEPRHLLGREDDIAHVTRALSRRLIFLVGESGSGKTALLQAGVGLAPEVVREFVPLYIDLTDQDWDDGLLILSATVFGWLCQTANGGSLRPVTAPRLPICSRPSTSIAKNSGGGRCSSSTSSTITRRIISRTFAILRSAPGAARKRLRPRTRH